MSIFKITISLPNANTRAKGVRMILVAIPVLVYRCHFSHGAMQRRIQQMVKVVIGL